MSTASQTPETIVTTEAEDEAAVDLLTKSLEAVLFEGKPMWEVCGWNADQIEGLYNTGFHLYQSGAYDEALNVFRPLALIDSGEARNWIAMGGCHQMKGEYQQALEYYGNAVMIDPNNPRPVFNALECNIALKMYAEAKSSAEYLIAIASDKPEHSSLVVRAKVLLGAIHSKISE
jgi:type III secretion system low calcium response chaperone LcrH/SycD